MCISELMEEGRCPIISGDVPADMPCGKLQILNLEAQPFLKEFQTGRRHQGGTITHSHFCIHSQPAGGREEP